jgi:hypothetical protein
MAIVSLHLPPAGNYCRGLGMERFFYEVNDGSRSLIISVR